MLLMGRMPIAFSLCFNQRGDSLMVILLMLTPEKRWQAILFSMSTGIAAVLLSGLKLLGKGNFGFRSRLSWWVSQAQTSRATPQWLIASMRFGVNPIS